jgi:hypothetical protein
VPFTNNVSSKMFSKTGTFQEAFPETKLFASVDNLAKQA